MSDEKTRTFFSKTSDAARRNLSNFAPSAAPIGVTPELCREFKVPEMNRSFDCIEAVYQAFKIMTCTARDPRQRDDCLDRLSSGGSDAAGLAAKRLGSKTSTLKRGLKLNPSVWTHVMERSVMKMAIGARAKVDPVYRAKLCEAVAGKFTWLHIETRKPASKCRWGGFFRDGQWHGQNELGQLMLEVARSLS